MRRRRVLLTLVPTLLAAVVVPLGYAGQLPGADYPWAQPNTSLPSVADTQPPPWVAIEPAGTQATPPGTAYVWAQPGAWAPQAANTQPAAEIVP